MDNFRIPNRSVRPRQALDGLDGFTRTRPAKQITVENNAAPAGSSFAQPASFPVQPSYAPQPDPYLTPVHSVASAASPAFSQPAQPTQQYAQPQAQLQATAQPMQQYVQPVAPQYVQQVPVEQYAEQPYQTPQNYEIPVVEAPPIEQPADVASEQAILQPTQPSVFDIATIEETEKPKNRLVARRKFRKWALRGGLVSLALMMSVGGVLFAQSASKVHKVFRGSDDRPAALTAGATKQLKGESTGHVNVLLLGNGGDGHEAPDLTDTLIVQSFDTVHKTSTLISVPRDLWVQVPKYGNMKINAAYEVGKYNSLGKIDDSNANTTAVEAGFAQVDQAIQTVLGIQINYNVLVNFTSFKQAVDAVGGVTVNVPEALVDPTMAWENNHNSTLAAAGTQVMNGKQALLYVRSRETSSDFARGERQRAVLLALKDKVLTAGTLSNPIKVSQLINAFGDNLVTDMSLSDAMRAYSLGKGVANSKIASVDLVTPPNNLVTTANMSGVSIDEPRAGLFDYSAIQAFVQNTLNPPAATTSTTTQTATTATPAATTPAPENAQITVLNGTAKAGLAAAKANALKSGGYNVTVVGNAPTKTYAKTVVVDYSNGADKNTRSYLEKTYGVTAVTAAPDPAIQPGASNFVVILGADQSL